MLSDITVMLQVELLLIVDDEIIEGILLELHTALDAFYPQIYPLLEPEEFLIVLFIQVIVEYIGALACCHIELTVIVIPVYIYIFPFISDPDEALHLLS